MVRGVALIERKSNARGGRLTPKKEKASMISKISRELKKLCQLTPVLCRDVTALRRRENFYVLNRQKTTDTVNRKDTTGCVYWRRD